MLSQSDDNATLGETARDGSPAVRAGHAETVRIQRTRRLSRILSPHELWRYRELAWQLAVRDVKVRYRQTLLGGAWAVLQPVGTMVVFSIFFGKVAGLSSDGVPYWLFSLCALVPWTFFSNALLLGSDSLVRNGVLISRTYFPRIFVPAGVVAAGLVDLAISFSLLIVVVLITGRLPGPEALVVFPLVLIAIAAAGGVSTALAALNVRYRDIRYIVPFLVQFWLLATPIAYSSTLLGDPWRTISALNPMVGVVEGFRWALLGIDNGPGPLIAVSAASAAVMLVLGLVYFARVERAFADLI
jgi:lipopolysaccharide transport system permease protein